MTNEVQERHMWAGLVVPWRLCLTVLPELYYLHKNMKIKPVLLLRGVLCIKLDVTDT